MAKSLNRWMLESSRRKDIHVGELVSSNLAGMSLFLRRPDYNAGGKERKDILTVWSGVIASL